MSFSFNSVGNQVTNLLGNIKGAIPTDAETNYTATLSTTSVKGPDFIPQATKDAVLETVVEIVEAIALTPFHLERIRYSDVAPSITSGGGLPTVGLNSGQRILGVHGQIYDNVNSIALLPASLDKIRAFNRFKSAGGIYAGKNEYWFAWDSRNIYHTRNLVSISVVAFDKPGFTGNVPLDDDHEAGVVMGAVMKLAPKENMFTALHAAAKDYFIAHLANIRSYGAPELWAGASFSPSAA